MRYHVVENAAVTKSLYVQLPVFTTVMRRTDVCREICSMCVKSFKNRRAQKCSIYRERWERWERGMLELQAPTDDQGRGSSSSGVTCGVTVQHKRSDPVTS